MSLETLRYRIAALLIVIVTPVALFAAGSWESGSAKGLDAAPTQWTVGGIPVDSGSYSPWQISGDVQTVGGQFGCHVKQGNSPAQALQSCNNVTDYSYHLWYKYGSPQSDTPTLNVKVQVTPGASGMVHVVNANDPSWWFRPTITVTQYSPKIYFMDPQSGEWVLQGSYMTGGRVNTATGGNYPTTGASQTPNLPDHPQGAQSGGHPGYSWSRVSLPTYPGGSNFAKVVFDFRVDATIDVDNCGVVDWREYLEGTLESYADSSDAGSIPYWL
jgi:hypothetical protein